MKQYVYNIAVKHRDGFVKSTKIARMFTDETKNRVLAIVKKEAYNGEYTIEEIPDPPHEPDVWDEMAEAYQRGVNRA